MGLAAATTVAALALLLAAWLVPRRRERLARRALTEYAGSLVAVLLDNASIEIGRTLHDRLYMPSRSTVLARRAARAGEPPGLAAWIAASDRTDDLGWVPRLPEAYRFRLDERSGRLEAEPALPAPLRRWLLDTLRLLPRTHGPRPPFLAGRPVQNLVLYAGTRGTGLGVAARVRYRDDQTRVLFGYAADVRPALGLVVQGVMERMSFLPGAPGALFGITVRDRAGALLAASDVLPVPRPREPGAPLRFRDPALGGVVVAVVPRAAAERVLVPAGSPQGLAVPVLGATMLLLLGLTLGAVWVARREAVLVAARVRFLAAVSHEFRTPLTQILLAADTLPLLHPAIGRPEVRSAVDGIVRAADRLTVLVDNVLHVARGDESAHGPRHAARPVPPVVLPTLVEDVVERYLPLASEADVRIEVDLAADVTVAAPREVLASIVVNLLDNAVKYGPPRQTVLVTLTSQAGLARLTVDDEGPGVPPAERARIWEPFVRGAQSHAPGSGLGLAVVRDLAEQLGGRASVTDAPGGGARFVVELPCADVPYANFPSEAVPSEPEPARATRPA